MKSESGDQHEYFVDAQDLQNNERAADPATSSAPFVTTLVDVTRLIIYFSIALVIMRRAMLQLRSAIAELRKEE